ncbi:uncharacterized protein LOC130613283 [Hydractinia symbiolongicarpus]|uniref:uncharacterized protein LOC130613283 n=1 Tax=Hydractinia symbiolongicarpus TaxID=13093 RepID=UPI00254C1795|nr:uncharacterized protein LOC130613283 [Hydractinia symbiolongicarpus]
MEETVEEIWNIFFYVLIAFTVISVLVCFIAFCHSYNCFCGCFERVEVFCGCLERDTAFQESLVCCGCRNVPLRQMEAGTVFRDCKIVQYNLEKTVWCCIRKKRTCQNSVCTICLDDYIPGENLIMCPCGHCYHKKCIKGWLRVKNVCPLCKMNVNRRIAVNERTPLLYG